MFDAQLLHKARVRRRVEIHLGSRRFIGGRNVWIGKERILSFIRCMAIGTVLIEQRINCVLERRSIGAGVSCTIREVLALVGVARVWCSQDNLTSATLGTADPVLDPGRQDRGANTIVVDPAIVAGTDFGDDFGRRGLHDVDLGDRRIVSEVNVIITDKHWQLANCFVVTVAAAIGGLGIAPEFLLEFQYLGVTSDRAGIRVVIRIADTVR